MRLDLSPGDVLRLKALGVKAEPEPERRVHGKGEQEKFFSISKWRALIDWPDVVSAEEES